MCGSENFNHKKKGNIAVSPFVKTYLVKNLVRSIVLDLFYCINNRFERIFMVHG